MLESSRASPGRTHTPRSIASPAKITFAGGKGLRKKVSAQSQCTAGRVDPYQADSPTEHTTRRKGIHNINSPFEPHHDLSIISSKVTESLCLLLKDIDDRVGRFAIDELIKDWMLDQVSPCSLLEFVQSGFEERFQLWRGIGRHCGERDGTG